MRIRSLAPLLLTAAAAAVEPAPPPQPGWAREVKVGAFVTAVAGYRSESSKDASISSTHDSVAYQASGDGKVSWTEGRNNVEHRLVTRFGRIRTDGGGWQDSVDEIDYDGVYRRFLGGPHFLYGSLGADTVYTGPEPEEDAFDPVVGKASAGYGQRWRKLLPVDEDLLELRIGVRAQKRWGRHLTGVEEDPAYGPEAWARYDAKVKEFWTLFAQYEAFSEFDDLAHVSHLATGGLDVQLARYLTLRLAGRAYYESRPEDAATADPGYDQLSGRLETLLGLTYLF
jgi:hypothetical protein